MLVPGGNNVPPNTNALVAFNSVWKRTPDVSGESKPSDIGEQPSTGVALHKRLFSRDRVLSSFE